MGGAGGFFIDHLGALSPVCCGYIVHAAMGEASRSRVACADPRGIRLQFCQNKIIIASLSLAVGRAMVDRKSRESVRVGSAPDESGIRPNI